MPTLFDTPDLVVRDLHRDELALLQALFDANPGYFRLVGGQPPRPDEAEREFDEWPPAPLSFTHRWFAGAFDRRGLLRGSLILLSDLPAAGVWHLALLLLADELHGTGVATRLHDAIEAFARRAGARWMRLGVVSGNRAAERFWHKCGYREVRTREITNASGQPRTVRVLVKSLAAGTLADYLRRVPRDAPASPLP